jgi:hypothetical protein
MTRASGYFIISLDFELMYGLSELKNQDYYKKSVVGGKVAIPRILELFTKYGIHATWSVVGKIMMASDSYHYAGNLIEMIRNVQGQEIGSHTFSHIHCLGEEMSEEIFESDCSAFEKIASQKSIKARSFVFPYNEVTSVYMKILKRHGFTCARGVGDSFMYSATNKSDYLLLKRLLRLADSYINISGMNCYGLEELKEIDGILIIPSSRFLRKYCPGLRIFERLKIHRIKKQMKYAAKTGKIFHLWFHPHNFGLHTQQNLKNLQEILEYFCHLNKKYGMQSLNMNEIVEVARK